MQTVGNNVGGIGGGIGYPGLNNSIGIEFDSWLNPRFDDDSNHIGINVNGSIDSVVRAPIAEADLNDGDIWNAWVDYNGATNLLEARLTRSAARPAAPLVSLVRDIALDLGTTEACVGFTSGTGSSHANHDVLNWLLNDNFSPIDPDPDPVPGPVSLLLLATGVFGLSVRKFLRRA